MEFKRFKQKLEEEKLNRAYECNLCKDKGFVTEMNGEVHTCFRCLANGRFNNDF